MSFKYKDNGKTTKFVRAKPQKVLYRTTKNKGYLVKKKQSVTLACRLHEGVTLFY